MAQSTQTSSPLKLNKTPSGVAFIIFDCAGKQNILSSDVMQEFDQLIDQVADDPEIKAVALHSGKPDTFITGADIREISRATEAEEASAMSRRGQEVFMKLSRLKKPTVIGINGQCLGGGLEITLWCTRRIATDNPDTRLGLPETKLGFVPGLGGTQRLPRIIGLKRAIGLILDASPITVDEARKIGLVDEIVKPDDLLAALERSALDLCQSGTVTNELPLPEDASDPEKLKKVFALAERSVRIKTKGKYPAQQKVLEVIKEGLTKGMEEGLEKEAKAFGELAVGNISHNLVFLFLNTEYARQAASQMAGKNDQNKIATVGVIGGGTMAAGIAHLLAATGHEVLIRERDFERLNRIMERVRTLFQQQGPKQKEISVEAMSHIHPIDSDQPLATADLVIEATIEDLEVKKGIFDRISRTVRPDCLLTTNTSSLSIQAIAESCTNPERVLGLHFFKPVSKMPLVEVITQPGTSKDALGRAIGFASQIKKVPIAVKHGPGFLVNRLLCTYLLESGRLAEQGVPLNWLDAAAIDFGFPMGPMELLDEVGLDLAFTVADVLHEGFGERMSPPVVLQKARRMGLSGKLGGEGIYIWDKNGKKVGFNERLVTELGVVVTDEKLDPAKSEPLAQRLLMPMIDEASRCLMEGVVRRSREIDLAVVLGLGFPPFRGGLLRYADSIGIKNVIKILKKIYDEPGPKREIAPILLKMCEEERRFYART